MSEFKPTIGYSDHVHGIVGHFGAPAGRVAYLLTKARIGPQSTAESRRLTGHLRPFREIIDTESLNFSQLLQRDLDDQRVATKLIPYLLGRGSSGRSTGPVFFPPVIAAMLPFVDSKPVDNFPSPGAPRSIHADGAPWSATEFGEALRWDVMLNADGQVHPTGFGALSWNKEKAMLVVLDGQHRAMALLALERTLNHTWGAGNYERYKPFYEGAIVQLVEEIGEAALTDILNEIEVPVTVCLFMPPMAEGVTAHLAARQLFVDVNKEAKPPSESRLVLLSDKDLVNMFTRAVLNMTKGGVGDLPLHAIEYDNPEPNVARPAKSTAVVNLQLIRHSVMRAIFGPANLLTDMSSTFPRGPVPSKAMDAFMREQLEIEDLWETKTPDGAGAVIQRDRIGRSHFPLTKADYLVERFSDTWGRAILEIFGRLQPYAIHISTLSRLRDDWTAVGTAAELARDSLFEGVGMYWMLEEAASDWRTTDRLIRPPKPAIVEAWDVAVAKQREFLKSRNEAFWPTSAEDAQAAYDQFNTFACQLGAVLAFGAVVRRGKTRLAAVSELSVKVVQAWNATLEAKSPGGGPGRLILSRSGSRAPLNLTTSLNTPVAAQFRYLWLEMLTTPSAREVLRGAVEAEVVASLVADGRRAYRGYLITALASALRQGSPTLTPDELRDEAAKQVTVQLRDGLAYWIGTTTEQFDSWHHALETDRAVPPDIESLPDEGDEGSLGASAEDSG